MASPSHIELTGSLIIAIDISQLKYFNFLYEDIFVWNFKDAL